MQKTTQILLLVILGGLSLVAKANSLPDFNTLGPYPVINGEYKLPATLDPLVTDLRKTELWGVVFKPLVTVAKPWPLVVFLHGNHGTCGHFDVSRKIHVDDDASYSETGKCPAGYKPVPSHRGYDYLASRLASWGYVVVSINVNRGINATWGPYEPYDDQAFNLGRGRMVLRHLAALSQWHLGEKPTPASLKFSLANSIDFSEVGLMGHSRGGEGMRAALKQYRDPNSPFRTEIRKPLGIRAIFEIAPVDGQSYVTLNADKVSSMILLSACDGDVAYLDGTRVFDRMLMTDGEDFSTEFVSRVRIRGTVNMLGGNHNFYNTEWQESDSSECAGHPRLFPDYGGSSYQQTTAINSLIPFFLGTVGKQRKPAALAVFDPQTPLTGPLTGIGGLERGFIHSSSWLDRLVLERFNATKPASQSGRLHITRGVAVEHTPGPSEHADLRVAKIEWPVNNASGLPPRIDISLAQKNLTYKVANYDYLGLRLTTTCYGSSCAQDWTETPKIDASIQLIDMDGRVSSPSISLAANTDIRRPVGAAPSIFCPATVPETIIAHFYEFSAQHSVLQHAYIPLADIHGIDKTRIQRLRITFNRTSSGRLLLSEISLQHDPLHLNDLNTARSSTLPIASTISPRAIAATSDTAIVQGIINCSIPMVTPDFNEVINVTRRAATLPMSKQLLQQTQQDVVEITLRSSRKFPVTNSLPQALLGNAKAIRVQPLANGKEIKFTFLANDYDAQPKNAVINVRIGQYPLWSFSGK